MSGRRRPITAPPPSRSSTKVDPPWAAAVSATIANPRPEPGSVRDESARWKRSKIRSRSSGATPGPRSATAIAPATVKLAVALTSNRAMIRRLGKNWKRLHRLAYVTPVLGVLHFWWLVKADVLEPFVYAALLAGLLLARARIPHAPVPSR